MKAMNMDESANGSLSVEFRHLVGLTAFLLLCTSGREIKDSLDAMEGELYYCQGHTHFLSAYTGSLLLEPLYAVPYLIHSIK